MIDLPPCENVAVVQTAMLIASKKSDFNLIRNMLHYKEELVDIKQISAAVNWRYCSATWHRAVDLPIWGMGTDTHMVYYIEFTRDGSIQVRVPSQ